jgi:AraC-like DNA-binding protein
MAALADRMAEMATKYRPIEKHIVPVSAPPANRPLYIRVSGHFPEKKQWVHQSFDGNGVGLVVAGRGTYRAAGGTTYRIEPGCVFFVNRGVHYDYGPTPGPSWEEYYYSPEGPGLSRWKEYGWFPTDGRVYPVNNMAQLIALFRELQATLARKGTDNVDRAVCIGERLIMEMFYGRVEEQSSDHGTSAHEVIAYCQAHFQEEIDFERLARSHAISYSRLRHRICELTGMPPARYIAELRCNAARALLAESSLAVKEIAQRVGIDDPYSFSRIFKRYTGSSPLEFRRQILQFRSPGES